MVAPWFRRRSQKDVDGRLGVEDANTLFYEAFMSGSVAKMDLVWGDGDHVQVIHPGCSCIAGRDNVMESWKSILAGVRPRAFRIELQDVRVFAADGMGFVTCVEVVDADDSAGRALRVLAWRWAGAGCEGMGLGSVAWSSNGFVLGECGQGVQGVRLRDVGEMVVRDGWRMVEAESEAMLHSACAGLELRVPCGRLLSSWAVDSGSCER
eukprot:349608-Chlamydomonas_euryale.AAC.9